MRSTRRQFLTAAAAAPFAALTVPAGAALTVPAGAEAPLIPLQTTNLPAPRFELSINLELMFPSAMPFEDRLAIAADCGARHYSFWGWEDKHLDRMLEVQHQRGMKCVSISGNPRTGWTTGLTKTGHEQAFMDDFEQCCQAANRVGADNLITFVGAVQKEIPWETQEAQIIAGLKKAGDIAQKYDVYLTLEPLNRVESPQMSMLTAEDAFRYSAAANHPRIKVDYDMYHRQLGEGNVLNNLRDGLKDGHIRFLEIGDVPGRFEPGSGESNYANIFRFLREVGYAGFIGMEHRTTRTPQYAWDETRRMAGFA